jgi:hypothetical protein
LVYVLDAFASFAFESSPHDHGIDWAGAYDYALNHDQFAYVQRAQRAQLCGFRQTSEAHGYVFNVLGVFWFFDLQLRVSGSVSMLHVFIWFVD